MPAADPRYCVAQISEEALEGWRDFCARHRIDRTALAEVIGFYLGETGDTLSPWLERMVREANDLKSERKRRG